MRLLTSRPCSHWGALVFCIAMSVVMPSAHGADAKAVVDRSGSVGSHTSLVLDGSGNPVVSYWDLGKQDLKVLTCDDPNCAISHERGPLHVAGAFSGYEIDNPWGAAQHRRIGHGECIFGYGLYHA